MFDPQTLMMGAVSFLVSGVGLIAYIKMAVSKTKAMKKLAQLEREAKERDKKPAKGINKVKKRQVNWTQEYSSCD
jgi:hypothetical protein